MPVVKEKAKHKGKTFTAVILFIIIILGVMIYRGLEDSRGVSLDTSARAVIEPGMGLHEVTEVLAKDGIIKSKLVFGITALRGGYATKLMPGSIKVSSGMTYKQILDEICERGRDAVDNRSDEPLVIPEGYELRQVRDEFVKLGICTAEEFDEAADPQLYDYDFLKDIPKRDDPLEGYLFPDTYYFEKTDTAIDVIDMILKNFDEKFTDELKKRAKERGATVDDIIIMASIIERETDIEDERAKVAGVFYNRIKQGMALQSCATVQYILKERKAVLSVEDTRIKSPYNTYINKGLPVGPIASPGIECIKAALWPEDTDALFFVMGDDGRHIFSKTYEEHLAAQE